MSILTGATTAAQMGTRHGSYTSGSGDPTGTSPGGTVASQYDRSVTERNIDNSLNVMESDTFNYAVSGSMLAYSAAAGAYSAAGAGTSMMTGAAMGAAPVAVGLVAGIGGGIVGAWVGDKLGHSVMSRIPGFSRLPETGEMPATTGHPIAHTSTWATLGAIALGAIAGIAVGALIIATGGTALIVIAAAAAAGGALAGLGAGFASAAGQYGTNKGLIGPGSPNVHFEGRPVAHVMTPVACTIHKVAACAEGAETVFVNNWPMTRIGHKTTCDGVVNDGCKSIAIDMDTSAIALDIDGGWLRRWTRIGLGVLNFLPIPRGNRKGNRSNAVDGAPPPNCRTCRGDPVDVASGKLVDTRTDFALPGTIPLVLTRSYSPGAEGLMGRDWASSWGRFLRIGGETTTYQDADGLRVVFHTPDAEILSTNLRMPHLEMLGQRDGDIFIFDRREQVFQCFGHRVGDRLLLTAIEDRNGNRITFRYRGADLFEITHTDGYKLDVNSEGGVIRALSLAGHETGDCNATWAYSSEGRLIEARSPQFGTLFYGYDDRGHINRWADTNATEVFYAYDGDRIVRSWTASGHMGVRLEHFPSDQRTVVHFTDGHHETFHYDKDGVVWKEIDGKGAVWLTEWDTRFNVTARVDPLGNRTEFTYDAGGNLTSAKDPTGATLAWSFTPDGQLASRTDAAGAAETFRYDDKGNLSAVIDATGGRVGFRRGEKGEVLRIDLPGGGQERVYYDQFMRPVRRIDPDGATQNMTYDREGRLIQLVDPEGGITRFDVTRGPDNPRGAVRRVELADGGAVQMTWDGEGQLATVTDGEGNTRSFRAGAFDLPLAAIDEAGQSLTFEHDTELRLTAVVNALGERFEYTYDVTGALVAEKDFSGLVTRYDRDATGRMVARRAPDGTVTRFAYDARGDLTEIHLQDRDGPRITRLEHDARGLLTLAQNGDGKVEFAYDILGRLVSEKLNGREIRSTYAPSSGLRTARSGDVLPLSLAYTLAGLPKELRVGAHAPLAMHHDGRGLEVLRQSAAGFALAQNYTAGGMLQTQLAGPASSLPDATRLGQSGTASRHSLHPGPATRAFRSYDWDRAGRAIAIKDGHWGESRFAYDKRGQVVATGQRDRHGVEVARTGYDYDPARNLSAIRGLAGFAKVEQARGGRTRARGQTFYQHDANGRVIEKRVEEPGFRPRVWRMAWNGEDRLVRLETPDGAVWAYAYDPLGRRIRRLKLVAGAKDEDRDTPPGGGFAYQWDGDQIVAEAPIYADGTVAWDRAEAWVYEPVSFRPLAKLQGEDLYYVVTDHIGTPRELISEDGTRTAWRARLCLWGKTEALTRRAANDNTAPDCPIRFQGQWFDEESGLHYNRFRYYDPEAGQYLSPDPIGLAGGDRPQGYVADPNGWVDPLGLNGCVTTVGRKTGGTGSAYNKQTGQGIYVLRDPITNEIKYVGRGDAPARGTAHKASLDKGHLVQEIVHNNNLTKAEAKFLEQSLLDNLGGAKSTNPMTNLYNQIRSYSPANPNSPTYDTGGHSPAAAAKIRQETFDILGI